MIVHLKIKIKTLAEEARIIRREERRWPGPSGERTSLHGHRVNDVRREARTSQLAYAYLRGVPYSRVEAKPRREPDWKRVWETARRFADDRLEEATFTAWCQANA